MRESSHKHGKKNVYQVIPNERKGKLLSSFKDPSPKGLSTLTPSLPCSLSLSLSLLSADPPPFRSVCRPTSFKPRSSLPLLALRLPPPTGKDRQRERERARRRGDLECVKVAGLKNTGCEIWRHWWLERRGEGQSYPAKRAVVHSGIHGPASAGKDAGCEGESRIGELAGLSREGTSEDLSSLEKEREVYGDTPCARQRYAQR